MTILFPGFQDVWTPVAISTELRDAPLSVKVAGVPLVLFRDGNGKAAALLDRCPHRGVALSLGRMKDGCLECPFHGWRFDGQGHVTHVPWNPDAKLDVLGGTALEVRERAGQIYVFTGAEPKGEPDVCPDFERPEVRVTGVRVVWDCHWTRAMENMLDSAHLPFVHRKTIGKGLTQKSSGRMDIVWDTTPYGATSRTKVDGADQPGRLDFRWPNQMNLFIPIGHRTFIQAVACVPRDERSTTMLLVMGRSFLTSALFDGIFHRKNLQIAAEDKAIVESSQPPEIPRAQDEQSVRTDVYTLHFRKRYDRELRRKIHVVADA